MMIRGVRLLIKKSKHFKGIHFLACIKLFFARKDQYFSSLLWPYSQRHRKRSSKNKFTSKLYFQYSLFSIPKKKQENKR